MSYGQQYSEYGGNPYGSAEEGYGGGYGGGAQQQGGYGGGGGGYGGQGQNLGPGEMAQRQPSNYSQPSQYSGDQFAPGTAAPLPHQQQQQQQQHQSQTLSTQDFLQRIEATKSEIQTLTSQVSQISALHQRLLSSPSPQSSSELEHLVSQTQILNTRIRDQIKHLETDTARSAGNPTKNSQVRTLKQSFRKQLEDYQREEQSYRQRYQEQIARQYRIVNPQASEEEVREAADANWGDEGVFQTALKSNRSATAQSTLSTVRARHADIQLIERTLVDLNQLFQDLAEQVALSEPAVQAAEEQTQRVHDDTKGGVQHLNKGVDHARRARKLKWIAFCLVLGIIVILALVLGLYFGLRKGSGSGNGGNNNGSSGTNNNSG